MRLTKRQLKRIIREEYTRLKRRGLIKESVSGSTITFELMDGGTWACPIPEELAMILDDVLAAQSGAYGGMSDPDEDMAEMMQTMDELYGMCEEMCWDEGATEEGLGAPISCDNDALWGLIQKAAQMY